MSTTTVAPEEAEETKKGGKKKLLIMVVAVLLLGGGGGYWFFLKPAAAEEEPVPGAVLPLEAIQINLQDNHYLRIGIALQQVEGGGGHGEIDGSKALDATIEIFSGESMEELAQKKHRQKLKKELEHELDELYHHDVMGVYFTDFVMQ